jgi:hypothetical protein
LPAKGRVAVASGLLDLVRGLGTWLDEITHSLEVED